MTSYKPYDIVVVPFPSSESFDKRKYRPALVISGSEYNQKNNTQIVAMITSAKKSIFWNDHKITDYKGTNLKNECSVRMKLFTVDSHLVKMKIGSLNKKDAAQIKKNLKEILK
jgi:mRNA interferase MazF